MKRMMCPIFSEVIILLLVPILSVSVTAAQPTLTGGIQFSTNATGAWDGLRAWNTVGGDVTANLYVSNTGPLGPFLNLGNGAQTSLNIPLTVGSHTFSIFGQSVSNVSHFSLNLFFDGNNVNPGISVFSPLDRAPSPPYPDFIVNSSTGTRNLNNSTSVPGSGSLIYTTGGFNVELTDYFWSSALVAVLDRVQFYSTLPNGANDHVGSFTLEVTFVPEPTGLILAATAAILGLATRRRG